MLNQIIEKKVNCRIKLDVLHGFGSLCNQSLKDSVCIIDDDQRKILFPVGRYLAFKYHDKNEEQFIKLPENSEKLVCMAVAPNRKYVAVSVQVKNDRYPQIVIYSIRNYLKGLGDKEKTFRYTDTKSTQFTAMAFSGGDARFLVCLTGPPNYQLLFLDINKQCRQIGMTTLGQSVSKLSIHPKENHTITISGQNLLKILRVQENQFKQLNEISNLPLNQHFTAHDWLDENSLVVGTDKGTVYLVENYGVKHIHPNIVNRGVTAVTCFSRGFLVGSDRGQIVLYSTNHQYQDGKDDYYPKFWAASDSARTSSINHISISTKNDLVAVSYKSNDIGTFDLVSLEGESECKKDDKKKQININYLFNGFHSGAITSMDVCLQRPLVVTCSRQDASIRVWNYMNFKCELARKFFVGEETNQPDIHFNPLLSVAFHPFGYYIAAGFVDKIRFFHLLHSELRPYREIVLKNCSLMKYSNGGQYLACGYNKIKNNIYFVNIYNSYTGELRVTLKGHSQMITELQWDQHDQELYSLGNDGNIFMYETRSWQRKDFQTPGSKYCSLVFAERGVRVVAGMENEENIVREVRQEEFTVMMESAADKGLGGGQVDKSRVKTFPMGTTQLTCLTYLNSLKGHQSIIAGCDQGYIRIYSSIFNQKPFEEMSSHHGAVNKVLTSPDGRYVFSAGQDGSLFIYQVSEISPEGNLLGLAKEEEGTLNSRALVVDEKLADVVLVARGEIEQYLNMQRQLRTQIENLENSIEQKHNTQKDLLEREKREAEDKMHMQIESFNMRYEDLKQQKQEVEKDYNNLLKNMENNHLKAVEELENLYEKKLDFENEKFIHLEQQMTEQRLRHSAEIEQLTSSNKHNLQLVNKKFDEKFQEVKGVYDITKDNAIEFEKALIEKLGQQEDEYEQEIEEIKQKHKKESDGLRMEISQMRLKQELLSKDYKNMKEDLEQSDNYKKDMKHSIEKLTSSLQENEERIRILVKEAKEQEEKLKKKEKKIYEYKYKVSDLQKAKHVLSFRTAEMRSGIEPKEAQIEKLKEELFKLEGEFENMLKTSQKQNDDIRKLNNQVAILQNSLNNQLEVSRNKQATIDSITMKIYNTVNGKDVKGWAQEMKNLYQQYVDDKHITRVKQDPNGVEERQRQIYHLENCVDQIHVSSNNIIKRRELDIRKKTKENAELIFDLNIIRKQNKEYDTKLNEKATKLERSENEKKTLRKEVLKLKQQLQKEKLFGHQQQQQQQQQEQVKQTSMQNNFMSKSGQRVQSSITFNKARWGNRGGFQAKPTQKKINGLVNQYVAGRISARPMTGGVITKGSNFNKETLSNFNMARQIEDQIDLENRKSQIIILENHVRKLREKILKHKMERGCNDIDISLDNEEDVSGYAVESQITNNN